METGDSGDSGDCGSDDGDPGGHCVPGGGQGGQCHGDMGSTEDVGCSGQSH